MSVSVGENLTLFGYSFLGENFPPILLDALTYNFTNRYRLPRPTFENEKTGGHIFGLCFPFFACLIINQPPIFFFLYHCITIADPTSASTQNEPRQNGGLWITQDAQQLHSL